MLAGYVKYFWQANDSARPEMNMPQRVLPDGCVELIFSVRDPLLRLDDATQNPSSLRSIVAGQISSFLRLKATGAIDMFGVCFQPAGAYPLLGYSLHEFTDRVTSMDQVFGSAAHEIENRILSAKSTQVRIGIMQEFLLKRLGSAQHGIERRVQVVANAMVTRGGLVSIAGLADEVSLGRRQLEKKFRQHVGLTPKLFARIMRFRHVLNLIKQCGSYDWPALVTACHYHDQSHLIRDFRHFSGCNPSAYLAAKGNTVDS